MTNAQSPIPILLADHAPFIGGAETVLLDLAARLPAAGFLPVVCTAAGSPLIPRLAALGLPVEAIPFAQVNRLSPVTPFRLFLTAFAIAGWARAYSCRLIHTNTVRAHVAGPLASLLAGLPLVWTLHDDTLPRRLFRLLAGRPAAITAVSQYVANYYTPQSSIPSPQSPITVLPNGIPFPPPSASPLAFRQSLNIPPDAPLVICIGRLVPWKGPDLFIRAAGQVGAALSDAHFALVGEPDPAEPEQGRAFYQQLLALAAATGLGERLHFAGFRADVGQVYAAADLVVHAARTPEPFGKVLIEAMAYGKPVVATDAGGPREIVVHEETGLLVPPGDEIALAGAMLRLLADPDRAQAMGAAGRQRVADHFTVERMVAGYLQVYDKARKSRRRDTAPFKASISHRKAR